MMADAIGAKLDKMTFDVAFTTATGDTDLGFMQIPKDTVAGVYGYHRGWVGDKNVVSVGFNWTMGEHVTPPKPLEHGHVIQVFGLPNMASRMYLMQAAIYLRQSEDRNGDMLAVDRQREDCVKLCAQRGWATTEYIDNDTSATNGKRRPAYQRMLADIRAGLIDAVVAWDLDRLYRQPRELEDLIDLADQKHLALATVAGDADLSTDNGRLFARIKGAVARSRSTARRAAEAGQQAARQGRHARAAPPCRSDIGRTATRWCWSPPRR